MVKLYMLATFIFVVLLGATIGYVGHKVKASIAVETEVSECTSPPEIKTCKSSYTTRKACAKCCMNKIWPPNKEPDYGQPYESAHCAESCVRVTEALCLDEKYVVKECKAISDGY